MDNEQIQYFFNTGVLRKKRYKNAQAEELFHWAIQHCPQFATECAIKSHLRDISLTWLIYLSTAEDKELFRDAFPKIVKDPADLHTFTYGVRHSDIRGGLGRAIKDEINKWMAVNLTDYWACRYRNKLKDVMRLTRPKPLPNQEDFNKRLEYIQFGKMSFERIKALKEVLSDMELHKVTKTTLNNIDRYRIHLEEIKHKIGNLTELEKNVLYNAVAGNLNYEDLIMSAPLLEHYIEDNHEIFSKIEDLSLYKKSDLPPLVLLLTLEKVTTPKMKSTLRKILKEGLPLEDVCEDVSIHLLAHESKTLKGVNIKNVFSLYESFDSRISVRENLVDVGEIAIVIYDGQCPPLPETDKLVILWNIGRSDETYIGDSLVVYLDGYSKETSVAIRELLKGGS